MSTPAQIRALPQHAQRHIAALEADLADARQALAAHLRAGNFTQTSYGVTCPHDVRLVFKEKGRDSAAVIFKGGRLEVSCEGGMVIRPQATNVIVVKPTHWSEF